MKLFLGICFIIFGIIMLKFTIKFWNEYGFSNGDALKGLVAGLEGIVLGIALIYDFIIEF